MFNYETAIKILKFCIQNNDMFAVQYDITDKNGHKD
jgi:hypothetical protein